MVSWKTTRFCQFARIRRIPTLHRELSLRCVLLALFYAAHPGPQDSSCIRLDRLSTNGVFTLLTKTARPHYCGGAWDEWLPRALSSSSATGPSACRLSALTNSFLRTGWPRRIYQTSPIIKRSTHAYSQPTRLAAKVQLQLNKANIGISCPAVFLPTRVNYNWRLREIMNKASCLESGVQCDSVWNTSRSRDRGTSPAREKTSTRKPCLISSLLPFRHVVPNGTYFIEMYKQTADSFGLPLATNSKP